VQQIIKCKQETVAYLLHIFLEGTVMRTMMMILAVTVIAGMLMVTDGCETIPMPDPATDWYPHETEM